MAIRKPKPLGEEDLMNYALRALGGRAHSMGEIREKLRRRAAQPGDIDTVVGRLKEAGYLNDRTFAESYAAARLGNEGLGKMRVLRDLRQRRVAPKLADAAVAKTFEGVDELQLVDDFLKRKYRSKPLGPFLAEEKNLASAYRRLRYAGFSSGASIRVLKKYAQQAGELDLEALDAEGLDGEGLDSNETRRE